MTNVDNNIDYYGVCVLVNNQLFLVYFHVKFIITIHVNFNNMNVSDLKSNIMSHSVYIAYVFIAFLLLYTYSTDCSL